MAAMITLHFRIRGSDFFNPLEPPGPWIRPAGLYPYRKPWDQILKVRCTYERRIVRHTQMTGLGLELNFKIVLPKDIRKVLDLCKAIAKFLIATGHPGDYKFYLNFRARLLHSIGLPRGLGTRQIRDGALRNWRKWSEQASTDKMTIVEIDPDEEAFIKEIVASPSSLDRWGIYADWLQEQGGDPHKRSRAMRITRWLGIG